MLVYARASESEARSEIVLIDEASATHVYPLTIRQATLIVSEILAGLWRVICN